MTYNQQRWGDRVRTLGDIAEGVFEEVAPLGSHVRYGLNRPPFTVKTLTSMQRNTPDYLCGTGDFVEVMGCGRDNVIKLKLEKWAAQKRWQKVGPVRFFFWNSNHSEWALLTIKQVQELVTKARKADGVQAFDDGNEYLGLRWEWIENVFAYVGA